MISRTYSLDTPASFIITHAVYFRLLQFLIDAFPTTLDNDARWQVQQTVTTLLLVYKYADMLPRETVLQWLDKIGTTLLPVYLISRVFFDKGLQLTTRFDLLKSEPADSRLLYCYFGLMSVLAISAEGRKTI